MNVVGYFLQVNIYLMLLYLFFYTFLRKETFHQSNRVYLLSSVLMSFLIPMTQFEGFKNLFIAEKVVAMKTQIQYFEFQYITVPTVVESFTWKEALVWLYWIGTLVFFVLFCVKIWKLAYLLKNKHKGVAFSFFNTRYVQPQLHSSSVIAYHEYVHSKQGHSVDIILFELLKVLFWFNPVIWFYQKSLRNLHEFIADEASARFQGDTAAYAMLILSNTLGVNQVALSNQFFNSSILKQRITMLHKNKSPKIAILKFGIVLPVFAAMLVFSSSKIEASAPIKNTINELDFNAPIATVKEKIADVKEKIADVKETVSEVALPPILFSKDTTKVMDFNEVDKPAQFTGGHKAFAEFMGANLKMPDEANKNNIQGRVLVGFIVNEKGEVTNVKLIKGIGGGCDEEGIRVMKLSPKWIPAENKGEKVSMRFQIPIQFTKADDAEQTIAGEVSNPKIIRADTTKKIRVKSVSVNKPLFILDGKPISDSNFENLNEKDIKSISVLKDESAISIYGDKGKNGVMIITTKKSNGDVKNYTLDDVIVTGYDISEVKPQAKSERGSVKVTGVYYNSDGETQEDKKPILKKIGVSDGSLVYVDGILTDKDKMNAIMTDQIESMEVFKGGEGSDVSIMLITTKVAPKNIQVINKKIVEAHGHKYKTK